MECDEQFVAAEGGWKGTDTEEAGKDVKKAQALMGTAVAEGRRGALQAFEWAGKEVGCPAGGCSSAAHDDWEHAPFRCGAEIICGASVRK